MLRYLAILALPFLAQSEDWVSFRSPGIEVVTNAGDRTGQETLNYLIQFQHALTTTLGNPDAVAVWPVRVVVFESDKDAAPYAPLGSLGLARDAWVAAVVKGADLRGPLLERYARMLIDASAGRMPEGIERGLAQLFSTLEVDGTRVTLGAPPDTARRNQDWARMHLLAVDPEYSGKLRVLLANLQRGADAGPAYRNAFAKQPEEIDALAAKHLKSGTFSTASISSKPVNPNRDLKGRKLEEAKARAALADLLLANPARLAEARVAFGSILELAPDSADAHEGLGLAAWQENAKEDAMKHFQAAIAAKSANARVSLYAAEMTKVLAEAGPLYLKAAKQNPRWAEPHVRLAAREANPARQAELLKAGAALEPRNVAYWRALADVEFERKQFVESDKAWLAAERAAASAAEREQIRKERAAIQEARIEQEAAERRRIAEEKEREIQKLKDEAMARIRAAEAKANQGSEPSGPKREVVPWWDGPAADAKVRGTLERVDCLSRGMRLVVKGEDGKPVQVLIEDPSKVVLQGGGELALPCGPQRPPRRVSVDYFSKPDRKLGTAGTASNIEFR